MYIEKKIMTNLGVPACYWKIRIITVDILGMTITMQFDGWYDEQTFLSGGQPLTSSSASMPLGSDDPVVHDLQQNTLGWLYTMLMGAPGFEDAVLHEK